MEISFFTDKNQKPTNTDVNLTLANNHKYWKELQNLVYEKYPSATEKWNFPGKKYGWSFRIKDKKRAIIYLLPHKGYFEVAFVFGGKAMKQISDSEIADKIKTDLMNAKAYAEGRGVRILVDDESNMNDIKKLVKIKIAN